MLPKIKESDPEGAQLRSWIEAPDEDFAIKRLGVYGGAYFARIRETLADDFRRVERALGEVLFTDLIAAYIQKHPSECFSLFYLGKKLPGFLRAHTHPDAPPWIADLAELDLWMTQAILMPDDEPITFAQLQSVPSEQWGMISFRPIHALQTIQVSYPVAKIWRALQNEESVRDVTSLAQPQTIVIWRQNYKCYFESMSSEEAEAFDMIQSGQPFGVACAAFLPDEDDPEAIPPAILQAAIQRAYNALSKWLNNGMLATFWEYQEPTEPPENAEV